MSQIKAVPNKSCTKSIRESLQISLTQNCPNLAAFTRLIGLESQEDIEELEGQLTRDLESAALYEDVLPVLQSIKDRGMKIALISNLATPYKMVVNTLKLDKYFDSIVYSCDVGYAKTDPRIFQHALNTLQSVPSESIMVGGSYSSDVQGASKLGIKGIQIVREYGAGLRENTIFSLTELI